MENSPKKTPFAHAGITRRLHSVRSLDIIPKQLLSSYIQRNLCLHNGHLGHKKEGVVERFKQEPTYKLSGHQKSGCCRKEAIVAR